MRHWKSPSGAKCGALLRVSARQAAEGVRAPSEWRALLRDDAPCDAKIGTTDGNGGNTRKVASCIKWRPCRGVTLQSGTGHV